MTGLRNWFAGRSLRERRLLIAMLALATLTLLWGGIMRPVGDGLSGARERHADAVVRLGETEARIDALHDVQRQRPVALTGALAEIVRAQADAAGFALAALDQNGVDGLHVSIPSARPGALLPWLARLEQSGVLVETAVLTDNGDRTVGAVLTLKQRRP